MNSILGEQVLVIKMDRDTVVKRTFRSEVMPQIRETSKPLIVLTNPAFLLSILQGTDQWHRYFGNRCLALLVLDEIHFYRSRDVTLLTMLVDYLIEKHACKKSFKTVILSATVGVPNELIKQLSNVWGGRIGLVKAEIDRSKVRGRKHVFVIKCSDEREIEGIVMEYLKEIIEHAPSPQDIDKTLVFVPNRNIAERLDSITNT